MVGLDHIATADGLVTPSKDESMVGAILTLPAHKPPSLQIDYCSAPSDLCSVSNAKSWPRHPSAASGNYELPVSSARILTTEDAIKKTLELTLDISGTNIVFEPGDSFGVLCSNAATEVDALLLRLDLFDKRHMPCKVVVNKGDNAARKSVDLPKHIPATWTTLFILFSEHCDIRALPKKALLRSLAEHTVDANQKRRLEELSSRQGSKEYADFVLVPKISLLDILHSFSSCKPPVECLLEDLPALQPRAYSIINSPLVDAGCIKFVFNLIDIAAGGGRTYDRHGVCTRYLDGLTTSMQKKNRGNSDNLVDELQNLSILVPTIHIFMRKFNTFRLPDDPSKPLILIGPGTGIAPFIGFLDHRSVMMKQRAFESKTFGMVSLFFGCRHKDKDFLYQNELKAFERDGVLSKMFVCFSRDEVDAAQSSPRLRYVQDCLRWNAAEVFRLIHAESAVVYVCGDARGMAKDVYDAFIDIVHWQGGLGNTEARSYLSRLQDEKRYLQDIWT